MTEINVTKIAEGTREGMTKCTFKWEYIDAKNTRHSGEGRFACLAGNQENWPGLIAQELKRRIGTSVTVKMPQRYTLGLKKAG